MKVTICQLHEAPEGVESDWPRLVDHVRSARSDLVLLPEMPFHPWLARRREVDTAAWDAAVVAHERWLERFEELAPAAVLGSRPICAAGRRLNEGFAWDAATGYRAVHQKVWLPDEEGFWEASWYEPGEMVFEPVDVAGARAGFLICTEMWFADRARHYGRAGANLLVVPRATPGSTVEKWMAGGRTAAVSAGAFCLSSNRGGIDRHGTVWSGTGWIFEPEEGELLASTSQEEPFVTREIDLGAAIAAKTSYPRYVEHPDERTPGGIGSYPDAIPPDDDQN